MLVEIYGINPNPNPHPPMIIAFLYKLAALSDCRSHKLIGECLIDIQSEAVPGTPVTTVKTQKSVNRNHWWKLRTTGSRYKIHNAGTVDTQR
jgi:hypothetical protein